MQSKDVIMIGIGLASLYLLYKQTQGPNAPGIEIPGPHPPLTDDQTGNNTQWPGQIDNPTNQFPDVPTGAPGMYGARHYGSRIVSMVS